MMQRNGPRSFQLQELAEKRHSPGIQRQEKPMPSEPMERTAGVTLEASALSDQQPPSWFAEALVLLRHLGRQGFWKKVESVRVARQCKDFEVCDFVIVLVTYAVSNEKGLRAFYAAVAPVAAVLMAVCGRDRMP